MSAIHIDLVFGEHNRKQEEKVSEDALKESALPVAPEILADEPSNDDKSDELRCTSECVPEEK
jgi:hypothetical protein